MSNNYLDFISNENLIKCISNLYFSYINAKAEITKKKFYNNKIDTIKLNFDSKFNFLDEESLVKLEISRQIDKSINNAIGTFHENILGSIKGFEKGDKSGYDIRALDNSIFAEIKNKHNTMNSSSAEAVFQKLEKIAEKNTKAKCYLVQILATSSFDENWVVSLNGKEYYNKRIFKISGDRFYSLLSKREDALFQLYKILPKAIDDFLQTQNKIYTHNESALNEIIETSKNFNRNIIDQITFDNFKYYKGFDKL